MSTAIILIIVGALVAGALGGFFGGDEVSHKVEAAADAVTSAAADDGRGSSIVLYLLTTIAATVLLYFVWAHLAYRRELAEAEEHCRQIDRELHLIGVRAREEYQKAREEALACGQGDNRPRFNW